MAYGLIYDVESMRNYFSVIFVPIKSYLDTFKDCVNEKGDAIPLVDKLTIKEIKKRISTLPVYKFSLHDNNGDDLVNLLGFLQNKADYFGYNNSKYDRFMLSALLMYWNRFKTVKELIKFLNEASQRIIRASNDDVLWKDEFTSTLGRNNLSFRDIDLMKVFRLDHFHKSLKQTSINIKWYNLLEWVMPDIGELDRHYYADNPATKTMTDFQLSMYFANKWERYLPIEYKEQMEEYNLNDVLICGEIVRLNQEEIRLRYSISKEYKVDVYSASRSTIADKVITKLYSKFTGLHPKAFLEVKTIRRKIVVADIISDKVCFKTDYFNNLLSELKLLILKGEKGEFEKVIKFKDTEYTLATGGLHSNEIPHVYTNKNYKIVDRDVASYYPNMIRSLKVCQKHFNPKAWFRIADTIVDERLEHKHLAKDKTLSYEERDKHGTAAACLKIVANAGIFGKMGSEKSFLCDKKAMYQVTINGQLFLLMLIESLELAGIKVISANTDGIVTLVPLELEEKANEICHEWEKYLGLELEFTEYELYACEGVNSYITRKSSGDVKLKGSRMNHKMFSEDLTKGYNAPIVAYSVNQYFLNGIPIMDTLRNSKSVLDFCKTQNVARKYKLEYTHIVDGKLTTEEVQRNTRYFISTNGGSLMKVEVIGYNEDNSPKTKKSSLSAGQRVTVCNLIDDRDISEWNINYLYYYNEAMNIVNPIKLGISPKGKGETKCKKAFGMYNSLFDDDDFNDSDNVSDALDDSDNNDFEYEEEYN